jgi:phytoene synthase
LFDIDEAMAHVVMRSTEPALAAVKLAWWRERLEELDHGKVPAEPRLAAAAAELLPRGISGRDLAALEDGWAALLDQSADRARAAKRGAWLFALGARLLGARRDDQAIDAAGQLFAAADVRRRGLIDLTGDIPRTRDSRIARPARPLTALAALAARDVRSGGPPFEPHATPGRAWTLLRHRLTGRL